MTLQRAISQPIRVVLYTRAGCHLCDDAKAMVEKYRDRFAIDFEQVDIDVDPALKRQYDYSVPVLEIAGVVRFQGRINEALLLRQLRADSMKRNR